MSSAYLLVSHGSRDPRPEYAMEQLAKLISQSQASVEIADWKKTVNKSGLRNTLNAIELAAPLLEMLVGTAYLELSAEPLHKQIKQFADRAQASGYNSIQIVPLFLLPGVHVMEDIPAQVAIAQQALGQIKVNLRPHLGTHERLSHLLANSMAGKEADTWILLAHGSRRPGAKQSVEAIAAQLNAVAAYWAVSPKLESRVKALVDAGNQQIGIMPYFLFAGGITDAIAVSVEQLKEQFPSVNFYLAEPIGASSYLADLIGDLIEK